MLKKLKILLDIKEKIKMCVIHIYSLTSSFDNFLKNTKLPVYRSHSKGDIINKRNKVYDDYGFSCTVSNKDWKDLDGQIEDAEKFINQYERELIKLTEQFDIDDMRFDFPYKCRLGDTIAVQGEYIPSSFSLLCGKLNIGIALSLYPSSECENDI